MIVCGRKERERERDRKRRRKQRVPEEKKDNTVATLIQKEDNGPTSAGSNKGKKERDTHKKDKQKHRPTREEGSKNSPRKEERRELLDTRGIIRTLFFALRKNVKLRLMTRRGLHELPSISARCSLSFLPRRR
jgi:hypothetical protein